MKICGLLLLSFGMPGRGENNEWIKLNLFRTGDEFNTHDYRLKSQIVDNPNAENADDF